MKNLIVVKWSVLDNILRDLICNKNRVVWCLIVWGSLGDD